MSQPRNIDFFDDFERLLIDDVSSEISNNDIIVAIDFGTSRTGVVWGIRSSIPQRELEVQPLDGTGVLNEADKKTHTAVLINSINESPIAFGYIYIPIHNTHP